jgi:hypothetical protein
MRLIQARVLTARATPPREFELRMSLVVAARRRTYLLLLSREGPAGVRTRGESRSRRIGHALTHASAACGAQVALFAPVHGRWGESLFELSFSVIAPVVESKQ